MNNNDQQNAKPVDEVRFSNVRVAIWENVGEKSGKVFFTASPEVSYTDDAGNWHQKKSYSIGELLKLEKAASIATIRIQKLNQEAAKAARLDDQFADVA